MTKQEFLEQLELLAVNEKDFDLYNSGEDDELLIPSVDVKIVFNDNSTFNIYRDFCYPLRDCEVNFENAYRTILQEDTQKQLERRFGVLPCIEEECGYGCPFDATLVGYWDNLFDIGFVSAFLESCSEAEKNVDQYKVADLIMESVFAVSSKFRLSKNSNDTLINEQKTTIVFAKDVSKINSGGICSHNYEILENHLSAAHYFCAKTQSGKIVAITMKALNEFFSICDFFNIDKSNFDFYSDGKNYLYIKGSLSAVIALQSHADAIVDDEYSFFVRKLEALKKINLKLNNTNYNFSHLHYREFEELCYDILVKQGFVDVHPVGKSNAPDGGKDIIATEEYKTVVGTERRKWIWQCKHSAKSLSRKDISEISDLLDENQASAYGLFCSSSLTPELINRLELKKNKNIRIMYYGITELNTVVSRYPDILAKYKLVGGAPH